VKCIITSLEREMEKKRKKYCRLDEDRFLQKPIPSVELVNRINKIMMEIEQTEILKNT
jgi:hypothetical protein